MRRHACLAAYLRLPLLLSPAISFSPYLPPRHLPFYTYLFLLCHRYPPLASHFAITLHSTTATLQLTSRATNMRVRYLDSVYVTRVNCATRGSTHTGTTRHTVATFLPAAFIPFHHTACAWRWNAYTARLYLPPATRLSTTYHYARLHTGRRLPGDGLPTAFCDVTRYWTVRSLLVYGWLPDTRGSQTTPTAYRILLSAAFSHLSPAACHTNLPAYRTSGALLNRAFSRCQRFWIRTVRLRRWTASALLQ